MSVSDIKRLSKANYPIGEYQLTSEIGGIVVSDKFKQGQQVNAGELTWLKFCKKKPCGLMLGYQAQLTLMCSLVILLQ